MKIKRTIIEDGNLHPKSINAVTNLPKDFIFSDKYYLREPEVILNLSYQRLFKAFNNTLNLESELKEKFRKERNVLDSDFEKLEALILEVLESINSNLEDYLHILKATTPANIKTLDIKEKFVSRWLKKAKHPTYGSFYKSIKKYKEEIAYYINQSKHEHGRIEVLVGYFNEKFTMGYNMRYVGDTPGGPMEILDLNMFKSILVDLNYHFYQVYRISEDFCEAFISSVKIYHSYDLKTSITSYNLPEFDNIIKKLSIKNLFIFPNNEVFSPKVLIKHDRDSLYLEYPYGITEENTKHIGLARIKGKSYEEHKLILVPNQDTINKIKNSKEGDSLNFSLDTDDHYLKIFLQISKLTNSNGTYIKVNYDNNFSLETYSQIGFSLKVHGGITKNIHVKIPEIDYLGIKLNRE